VLKDGDRDVRFRAVCVLDALSDVRAVEPLIAVLRDEDSLMRSRAVHALGQIGDGRAVEPLLAALNDEDRGVRERAAETLALMYKAGTFDEQVKRAILAQADEIRKLDRASHRDHSDRSWGGCFGDANHEDSTSRDPGFHADFSL
jgi:HEAT repeat protein